VACYAKVNAADQVLLNALDTALGSITKHIQKHEHSKRLKGSVEVLGEPQPGKLVKFGAKNANHKLVKEPAPGCTARGRGLSDYLALPLDQYSLLDPKWITRPDPAAQDVFLLKVPLRDVMGLNLEPEVWVRVEVDAPRAQVTFIADRFKLGDDRFDADFSVNMHATLRHKPVTDLGSWGASLSAAFGGLGKKGSGLALPGPTAASAAAHVGDVPDGYPAQQAQSPARAQLSALSSAVALGGGVDADAAVTAVTADASQAVTPLAAEAVAEVEAAVAAAAAAGGVVDPSQAASSFASSYGSAAAGAEGAAAASPSSSSAAAGSGSDATDVAAGVLHCDVALQFQIMMPHPLSVVPGPLLALAGGLLSRLAVQSMLPGFLDMLSVDYGRWAQGTARGQSAGSLITQPAVVPQQAPAEEGSSVMGGGGGGGGPRIGAAVASVAAAVPGVVASVHDKLQQ